MPTNVTLLATPGVTTEPMIFALAGLLTSIT
jgi:hypothetical protein